MKIIKSFLLVTANRVNPTAEDQILINQEAILEELYSLHRIILIGGLVLIIILIIKLILENSNKTR